MPAEAPLIFGEVLFDCFEDGTRILGGAPFNVAWHLQALGDAPLFVSRIGADAAGAEIEAAMREWGMELAGLERDSAHPTGEVSVRMEGGQPRYTIREDAAWDFIDVAAIPVPHKVSLLYHGTLALRSAGSRHALQTLLRDENTPVYVDINLREPWWDLATVQAVLGRARWCKLNEEELRALGFVSGEVFEDIASLQDRFPIEQAILTRGEEGAIVRTASGHVAAQNAVKPTRVLDSVGAGDAFSAMYIHGLLAGWSVERILSRAQEFASAMLGQRGATVRDPSFYEDFR